MSQPLERLLTERVLPDEQLDATAAIYQVDKGCLAMSAARRDSPCYAVLILRLLAGLQFRILVAHARHRHDAGEGMRERLDALGAQPFELRATVVVGLGGQRSIFVILSLRCGPRGTGTDTTSLRLCPSSALPTGDSFDSFISLGLASAEPTILYLTDFSVF